MAGLANDKKAVDTVILELKELSTIADYFVICSGDNTAQKKVFPRGKEGLDFARWVLIDYGDIVIHIFNQETRGYYDLEKFWIDAPRIDINEQ